MRVEFSMPLHAFPRKVVILLPDGDGDEALLLSVAKQLEETKGWPLALSLITKFYQSIGGLEVYVSESFKSNDYFVFVRPTGILYTTHTFESLKSSTLLLERGQ